MQRRKRWRRGRGAASFDGKGRPFAAKCGEYIVRSKLRVLWALAVIALLALVIMVTGGKQEAAAQDGGGVHLLTVVSARDEVVIGLTENEVPALAARSAVGVVADLLAAQGRLSAWRYAPTRGEDGVIRLMPIYRLAIFAAGTIRLEPYVAEQDVVAPQE